MRTVTLTAVLLLLPSLAEAQGAGWRANADSVRSLSTRQPHILYDESRVANFTLPDPLAARAGTVRGTADWAARRAEILELFRESVYGRTPGPPERLRFERLQEDPRAMGGRATLRRVAVVSARAGREHRFELTIFLPNRAPGPAPLFLLLNNRPGTNTDPTRATRSGFWPAEEMIARGYAVAALQVGELAPDDSLRFREGVIRLFEGDAAARPSDAPGALAAWAWGASRAMDYFLTDDRVDARRVAVVGHSRGGKAALWAAAQDERFAMAVSNESGEGGAALARRGYGERVEQLTTVFPHWFAPAYRRFAGRESELPLDQHLLLSTIAPRALYVASAGDDLWADPRGEYLSLVHASAAYALWGEPWLAASAMPPLDRPLVAGRRGYHVRSGGHNLTTYDWERFADFADHVWGAPRRAVAMVADLRRANALSSWTLDGTGAWEASGGKLVLARAGTPSGPVRRPAAVAVLPFRPVERASIRAEVRSTALPTVRQRDLQIVFGYESPTRFYYVHLSGVTDAVHNGIFLVHDADRRRIDDGTAAPQLTDTEWHRVRVERDGDTGWIEVYLDGATTPALRARDTTIRSGRVGVGSFDDTGEFRDITVSAFR